MIEPVALASLVSVFVWCPCAGDMVHVANCLYLCSYLVRDILWLRILTILAGLSLVPFYCHCSERILWAPIAWNVLFITVNVIQIGILLWERWPRPLSGPARQLYDRVFSDLTPGEFRFLLEAGGWRDVPAGTLVARRDEVVADMMVLEHGSLEVRAGDSVIARLRPGQFIGEMSFVSGDPASADVLATEPCRVLAWSQTTLEALLEKKPALAFKLRGIIGRDVVAKLRRHADGTGQTPGSP
jgi:hypothetical protein